MEELMELAMKRAPLQEELREPKEMRITASGSDIKIEVDTIKDCMIQLQAEGTVQQPGIAFINNPMVIHLIRGEKIVIENSTKSILSISDTRSFHGVEVEEGMNINEYLAGIENELLQKALVKSNGAKTKAAELLGLTLREFRYRLSKYKRPEERRKITGINGPV